MNFERKLMDLLHYVELPQCDSVSILFSKYLFMDEAFEKNLITALYCYSQKLKIIFLFFSA